MKACVGAWLLALLVALGASPLSAEESPLKEALTLDRQGFIEESIPAWKKFIATQPEKPLFLYAQIKMCMALSRFSRYTEAVAAAEALIDRYPDQFDAQFNLANMYAATQQFSKSVQAYEKAVALNSKEGLAYVGLGLSYFGEEKVEQSVTTLRKVRKLFKSQKNISWYQNVRIMIGQIKGFAPYPPDFSNLWLINNLKLIRETYEKSVFKEFEKTLDL